MYYKTNFIASSHVRLAVISGLRCNDRQSELMSPKRANKSFVMRRKHNENVRNKIPWHMES